MKKLLSLAVALCLTFGVVLGATASTRPAFAEDTAEAQALLTKYYNGGYYTKATEIYQEGFPAYQEADFHAGASELVRRTEYTPGRLYMSNSEGAINSGYKDVDGNMAHFSIVEGQDVVDYTVKNTSVKKFFTDLEEMATIGTWQKVDNKYETAYTREWRDFVAPMWIGSSVTPTKVVMYEANGLVLQLWSDSTEFARAVIRKSAQIKTFYVEADETIHDELGITSSNAGAREASTPNYNGYGYYKLTSAKGTFSFTAKDAGSITLHLSCISDSGEYTIAIGDVVETKTSNKSTKNVIVTYEYEVGAGDLVTIASVDKDLWVHYVEYAYEETNSGGEGGEVDPDPTPDPDPEEPDLDENMHEVTYAHNFTESGATSDFFAITGNLATDKGSTTYNELTLTQCLKMESATEIILVAPAGTLTLVFGGDVVFEDKRVKVDGVNQTVPASGVVVIELSTGEHTITKGDTLSLFYMSYTCVECIEHTPGPVATCTEDQTCTGCGMLLESAFGHTEDTPATCKDKATCLTCGESYGELSTEHTGGVATCTAPATCTICGSEYGAKSDHVDEDADNACDSCGTNMSEVVEESEILTFTGTTKYNDGKLVHDENAIAAFSVKVLGGSATVTANTATCDADGKTFDNVLLPGGGSRSYQITAKKTGTITVYFTATNGSFSEAQATITFGGTALAITSAKDKCFSITINVVAGQTYNLITTSQRLGLYAVEYNS